MQKMRAGSLQRSTSGPNHNHHDTEAGTLSPHQVETALFAFRSPLSQDIVLTDETLQKLDAWADDLKVGLENEIG